MALKQNPILHSFHKFGHFSTWKIELKLEKLVKFMIEQKITNNIFEKRKNLSEIKSLLQNPVFVNFTNKVKIQFFLMFFACGPMYDPLFHWYSPTAYISTNP